MLLNLRKFCPTRPEGAEAPSPGHQSFTKIIIKHNMMEYNNEEAKILLPEDIMQ